MSCPSSVGSLSCAPAPQWLCVPFALMSPAVVDIRDTAYNYTFQSPWLGSVDADRAWWWIDNFLLLV